MSKAIDNALRLNRANARIEHFKRHGKPILAKNEERKLKKEIRKHKLHVRKDAQ